MYYLQLSLTERTQDLDIRWLFSQCLSVWFLHVFMEQFHKPTEFKGPDMWYPYLFTNLINEGTNWSTKTRSPSWFCQLSITRQHHRYKWWITIAGLVSYLGISSCSWWATIQLIIPNEFHRWWFILRYPMHYVIADDNTRTLGILHHRWLFLTDVVCLTVYRVNKELFESHRPCQHCQLL